MPKIKNLSVFLRHRETNTWKYYQMQYIIIARPEI
jgi:hypothetical protein